MSISAQEHPYIHYSENIDRATQLLPCRRNSRQANSPTRPRRAGQDDLWAHLEK